MEEKVIAVSSVDYWFTPIWTRKQRFAKYLSENGYRVLYSGSPVFFTNRAHCFEGYRGEIPKENLVKISDTLHIMISPIPVPGRMLKISPLFDRLRFRFHYQNVRRALEKLNWKKVTVSWAYFPQSVFFKGALGEDKFVFDWIDRFDAYPGVDSKYMAMQESRMIREADTVISTARGLYEEAARVNPKSFFIPNGVDFEAFQKESCPDFFIKHGVDRAKWKHTVALIGGGHDWIDLDLVGKAAKALPEFLFVVAGPVKVNVEYLTSLGNVVFLGIVQREDIPAFLNQSDVCINPFKIDRLSDSVNPLKVYEYLASGKPVVSVPMPEIKEFSDVITFVNNPEQFIQGIRQGIHQTGEEEIKKRKQAAEKHDWKTLSGKVKEIIDNLTGKK